MFHDDGVWCLIMFNHHHHHDVWLCLIMFDHVSCGWCLMFDYVRSSSSCLTTTTTTTTMMMIMFDHVWWRRRWWLCLIMFDDDDDDDDHHHHHGITIHAQQDITHCYLRWLCWLFQHCDIVDSNLQFCSPVDMGWYMRETKRDRDRERNDRSYMDFMGPFGYSQKGRWCSNIGFGNAFDGS